MRRVTAMTLLCLIAFPAQAIQIDCDLVRRFVAEHGKVKALAFALKNGATLEELKEARKCILPPTR